MEGESWLESRMRYSASAGGIGGDEVDVVLPPTKRRQQLAKSVKADRTTMIFSASESSWCLSGEEDSRGRAKTEGDERVEARN